MNHPDPAAIWHALPIKLIAILRGVRPDQIESIATALLETGFRCIEVPLNSPNPFDSIARLVAITAQFGEPALVGAGTVLDTVDVARLEDVGGNLVVSPNVDPVVIKATRQAIMASFPGVFTASEAHLAVKSGASGLKVFPASILGAAGIKAIAATLPAPTSMVAVGGVKRDQFRGYMAAGVTAFGLGSNLYKPGDSARQVRENAQALVDAYTQAMATT